MSISGIHAAHFNGGTITWWPVEPYANSSTVIVTVFQSYSWTLSRVTCAPNVPISTSSRVNQSRNLTCVANCANQGSYAYLPVDIVTDCVSSSSAMDMMKSQRAKNITLDVGAYFSIAYRDESWRPLNNSANSNWSIVCGIDVRRRPDGLINTPPLSNIASPQYVIFNRTTQITIPVFDVNYGDDLRCRWSANPSPSMIDECNGVCYSSRMPSGTNLSSCVLTFTGTTANSWYAVALQIEDFLDPSSTTAMSSVPIQFLIYVLPTPICSLVPLILPITDCLEVQVNVPITFTLYAMNFCNRTKISITDITITIAITDMNISKIFNSTTNSTLSYITLNWIPQSSQIGLQHLCSIAYTSEKVQSVEYCVTFDVISSNSPCATTTTTITQTTTSITMTTSPIATTTAVIQTTTATITASTQITTVTSTVNIQTTTATTTAGTQTTTTVPSNNINIPLIASLSLLALLLSLCCCCWWWYYYWKTVVKRRQDDKGENKIKQRKYSFNDRKDKSTNHQMSVSESDSPVVFPSNNLSQKESISTNDINEIPIEQEDFSNNQLNRDKDVSIPKKRSKLRHSVSCIYRLNKVSSIDSTKQNGQMNEKIVSHNFISSNRTSRTSDVPKSINDQRKRSETVSTVIVIKVKKSHKSKSNH